MILLHAQNVARYFGSEKLFDDLSLTIQDHDRLALVGRNGSGKSTLLKILAGIEEADQGQVVKAKDISIGYLAQRTGIISDRTIWEEMLTPFAEVIDLEKQMRAYENKLADEEVLNQPDLYESTLKSYDHIQNRFKSLDGYAYRSEIKAVLAGFHFYEEDYGTSIQELSGGQKTRLALAKLLLEKPDLLILDEPTNHLDMDSIAWLENYLKGYQGAILIVSHDRYFLDVLVNEVYDLSFGRLKHYTGNYSTYLVEKEKDLDKQWKDYEKQQKEIKQLEDFIEKNISRASTSKRAQSRQKQLDAMIRLEKPKNHSKSANIIFNPERESGDLVLQVNHLTIGYDGQATASDIELEERKNDIIAIVGPNGVGKSTLLKTIVGILPAIEGEIILGTKVDVGYYDQEQQQLHQNKTILHELWDDHPGMDEQVIRSLLGAFLFSGDDVLKTIASLSGGEKARVALAKLALDRDNFLILDEPTNHLDIDSKEVLEEALLDFEGTLLFVSHDRYFINKIANKVVEIQADGSQLFLGNYDYYMQKKEELEEMRALKEEPQENTSSPQKEMTAASLDRMELKEFQREERRLEREIQQLEEEINQLTEKNDAIHNRLLEPEVYNDLELSQELADQMQAHQANIDQLSDQWEILALELEDLLSEF